MPTRRDLLGAAMNSRLIDPKRHIERAADADHGVLLPRDIAERQSQEERKNAEPSRNQNFISQETVNNYIYNPAANTTTKMFLFFAAGLSTFTLINSQIPVGAQCRLLSARIMASDVLTAGTAYPQFEVAENSIFTAYPVTELTLAAGDYTKSTRWDWDNAVQIASDASVYFEIVTDAGYLPTTLDYWVAFTLGFGMWTD